MKNLTNKLHTLTTNKVEIHNLQNTNTKLVSEILPLLNKEIKALKELPIHSETKKATLAKIIKLDLDSKEPVVNTALNLIILGINLDNTLPLSKINQVITLVNKKTITKNWINKATKEQIETKLSAINKAHKLEIATKLVTGKAPVSKAKTTKAA